MSSSTPADTTPTTKSAPSAVEFEPPLACVRRILKQSLPSSTNCGKDASQAFTRACGIFVIYVTACANDIARESKRTTITANDVLAAMKELNFGEFIPEMQEFLAAYRATEKQKKEAKAAAKAAEEAAAAAKETPPKKAPEEPTSAVSSVAEPPHEETEGDEDDKTHATAETNEGMDNAAEQSSKEDDDDDDDKKVAATEKEEGEPEPMEE